MIGFGDQIAEPRCSRAGCGAPATSSINWRNPKIHSRDRVKVWLACDEHRDFLREFLLARNFPVAVDVVGAQLASVPDGIDAPAPDGP
ncbi:hypothetical protein B0I08_101591 [Glaciihabitans tibetensis]|uniref:Acetone carboxylase n=1 Tax=Glaciihabitans tibetensis TaxID=1266600 RepID=A0A2T0VK06_9MICO|nr:hypothetical protein [Glaciihabitans tibetensis]PRY70455.1 hypothetical protein B0I08_101591 [Glaciihabitans tibetensis]